MTKKVRKSEKGRGIETTTTIAREVGVTGLSKEQGGRNEEFRWRKSRGGGDKYVGGSGEDFSCFISPARSHCPHLKEP